MSRKSKKTQAKGLVPRLRFPEFQNDGEWEEKLLSTIASPVKNRSKKSNNIVLTLSSEFGVISQREYFGKKIAGENTARYLEVMENDFIYNDRVTTLYPYGTIKRLSKYKSGIVSPIYKCFRFNKTELPVFWEYYFSSNLHNAQLRSLINEGARAGRFNISIEKFLTTSVYYKKPRQQKIADCLTSLDELVVAQSQKIDQLKGHKKGLMQKLFPAEGTKMPSLRFPEFQATGEWEEEKLGEVVTVLQGTGFPEKYQGSYNGTYPFYKVSDITTAATQGNNYIETANNYINEDIRKIIRGKIIPLGSIIFAKIGEAIRLNRRVITTVPCLIDNNVAAIKANEGILVNYFAFLLLCSIDLNEYSGGVVPSVSKATLENITITLPDLVEQQKIADCLTSLDELIAAHTNKLELLKAQKKGLMQGLFPSSSDLN